MRPETIILILACVIAVAAIGAVGLFFLRRDALSSRLKTVAKRREALQEQQRQQRAKANQKGSMLSESHVALMKRFLEKVNLEDLISSRKVRAKLSAAGYRGQAPVIVYAFLRVAAPVGLMLIAAFYMFVAKVGDLELMARLGIVLGAGGLGYILPGILLQNTVTKRQKEMTKGFPNALDLLVICVEAGLSLEAAFARVSEEMMDSAPIVAQEFGLTTAELAFLADRRVALENLATRTGLDSVKSLTTALIQSEKYGTPLAQTLRVLAQESRDDRMARAEMKAAALGAKMTVPMMIFILPCMFIVVIGPAIIQMTAAF